MSSACLVFLLAAALHNTSPTSLLLSVLSGSYRFPDSAPHVPERSHARPSTSNRKHRPLDPGGPDSLKRLGTVPVGFIMLRMNFIFIIFFFFTDVLVVVLGAASPLHGSPRRHSDAGVPARLQSASQQWHQRERSTIPVHADGESSAGDAG